MNFQRHPCEKIFGVQLAGGFADTMAKASQIVVENFDVDFIDINMGCPIDVVNQKGGGCALPSRPQKLFEVLAATKSVLGGCCPLTVKIRTGMKEGVLKGADLELKIFKKICPKKSHFSKKKSKKFNFCIQLTENLYFPLKINRKWAKFRIFCQNWQKNSIILKFSIF